VIEPSGLATVGILGGQHQWFPAGHPAELVCAASVSSLIDRVEWSRAGGGELPDGANSQDQRGVLKFESFKVNSRGERFILNFRRKNCNFPNLSRKMRVNMNAMHIERRR
jgi:hypothetical protein